MGHRTRSPRRRAFDITHRALPGALLLVLALCMPLTAGGAEEVGAVLDGRLIDLSGIVDQHCHDRDTPLIRCFSSPGDRDQDLEAPPASRSIDANQPYVTVFADEGYRGGSFTLYNPNSDLSMYGWNDCISSLKSLNAQRPRLYAHAGYGTPSWRWAAGAWVSNVGSDANDAASSIKNDP